MKTFIIDIELYDFKIHVLHNLSDKEFQEYILSNFDITQIERKESVATCWTIYDKEGKPNFALDFKKKLKKDGYSLNTIIHESSHIAFDIMDHINVPYTHEITDEAFCPLIAYISQKVYEGIWNK